MCGDSKAGPKTSMSESTCRYDFCSATLEKFGPRYAGMKFSHGSASTPERPAAQSLAKIRSHFGSSHFGSMPFRFKLLGGPKKLVGVGW